MRFHLQKNTDYWRGTLTDATHLNPQLIAAFKREISQPAKQSHYFYGRFENIYFEPDQLPELRPLLSALHQAAQTICGQKLREVSNGYWLNQMAPGQRTSLHSHDETDEILSAVYYLHVPKQSGNLVLHPPTGPQIITPQAGQALFFAPTLAHEVEENQSSQTRLSLALNFAPA